MKRFLKLLAFMTIMMTIIMTIPAIVEADGEVGTIKPQIVGYTNKVTLAKGDKVAILKAPVTLKASGVTYISSDSRIVKITKNESGTYYAYALKTGTATITAKSATAGVASGTLKVTVVKAGTKARSIVLQPNDVTLYVGQKVKSKVTTNPNAASKKMIYSSSNENIATVSSNGIITGKAGGTATITARATDGSNKKSSVTITVTQAKWTGKSKVMMVGDSENPSVYFSFIPETVVKDVEYLSGDTSIIKIENGKIVAVGAGKTTVKVRVHNKSGVSKIYQFSVKSNTVEGISADNITDLHSGDIVSINAKVLPASADQSLTYEVANSNIASVDSNGNVTGKSRGTTTITISSAKNPSITKTINVTVKEYLTRVTRWNTNNETMELVFGNFQWIANDMDDFNEKLQNLVGEIHRKLGSNASNVKYEMVRNGVTYTIEVTSSGMLIKDADGNQVDIEAFLQNGQAPSADIKIIVPESWITTLLKYMEQGNTDQVLEYNGVAMSAANFVGFNFEFGKTNKVTIVYTPTNQTETYTYFVSNGYLYLKSNTSGDVTNDPIIKERLANPNYSTYVFSQLDPGWY